MFTFVSRSGTFVFFSIPENACATCTYKYMPGRVRKALLVLYRIGCQDIRFSGLRSERDRQLTHLNLILGPLNVLVGHELGVVDDCLQRRLVDDVLEVSP